mgnify:CR=1 FL=1
METSSLGTDDSLGAVESPWVGRRGRLPVRPLPALLVACQPASVLLVASGLWSWGLALLGLSHAILLVGIFVPALSWFGRTHTRLPMQVDGRPKVWLTIDDGPDPRTTPELLEVLDRFGVRATFFVIGDKARRHPELLAEIAARGHQLGNHSTSHPAGTFWCLPPQQLERELQETSRLIRAVTGSPPEWFRPPVGHQNPFLHPIADRHGMQVVTWSASAWDGVSIPLERAVRRIERRLTPGTILVLHEGYDPGSRGYTPAALLEAVLERLTSDGYSAVAWSPRD